MYSITLRHGLFLMVILHVARCAYVTQRTLQNSGQFMRSLEVSATDNVEENMYRLFNVLCWLWNIYEGAELPSVYFITNTKHCITYLALTQLFPVLVSHPEMYTLCSILLHFV